MEAYQAHYDQRIRPLATVSDKSIVIEGYGTIEPISRAIPNFSAPTNYFGIFIPKGVPQEVVATLDKAWSETIASNDALKKYSASRGAFFGPLAGDSAQKAAFPAVPATPG